MCVIPHEFIINPTTDSNRISLFEPYDFPIFINPNRPWSELFAVPVFEVIEDSNFATRFTIVSDLNEMVGAFSLETPSAVRWLTAFRYYHNTQRPNQALNGRTPAEKVLEQ